MPRGALRLAFPKHLNSCERRSRLVRRTSGIFWTNRHLCVARVLEAWHPSARLRMLAASQQALRWQIRYLKSLRFG